MQRKKEFQMTGQPRFTLKEGQHIEVNGLNLYYEVYGSGRPLLMLHSGMINGRINWQAHLPLLSESFKVFMPDLRGHGKTDNPEDSLNYALMSDDIVDFCSTLGLKDPILCGYGDGGQICLEIGMRYPSLPRALVIGGSWYYIGEEYIEGMKKFGMISRGEVDIESFQQNEAVFNIIREIHTEYHGEDYWTRLLHQLSELFWTPLDYSRSDFELISAPTLIILGDKDNLIPIEQATDMHTMIPNASLAIAPNAGHGLPLSNPELFDSLIIEFLLKYR